MKQCDCDNTQVWVDKTQPAECDETIWVDGEFQTLWFDGTTETHWDRECPDINWSIECP